MDNIAFESLAGEHTLDAVDLLNESVQRYGFFEDSQVMRFRLDGIVYTAIENPDDGYRSSLDRFFTSPDEKMANEFPPVRVVARMKANSAYSTCEILELIDITTGKIVVEVGTDNSDDYYPSFVSAFSPENMATNAAPSPKTAECNP